MNQTRRPVLCVIDLTEASVQVLEIAAKFARTFNEAIVILYPYRLLAKGYSGEISKLKARLEQEAYEKFKKLTSDVDCLKELKIEFHPEIGFVYDRVRSYIQKNNVAAVVISQRDAISINEHNESALQELIESASIPFTIVPQTGIELMTL